MYCRRYHGFYGERIPPFLLATFGPPLVYIHVWRLSVYFVSVRVSMTVKLSLLVSLLSSAY